MTIAFTQRDIDRYFEKFDQGSNGDCWQWQGETNASGRARVWFAGAKRSASHVALLLDDRPRPDGLVAMHSCDNPGCVNPKHLTWGTQIENVADREAKGRGRAPRGEQSPKAKLTSAHVRAIKNDPRTVTAIAREYGVRVTSITNIKTGRTWGNV